MTTPTQSYVEVPANASAAAPQPVVASFSVDFLIILAGASFIALLFTFFFCGTSTTTKSVVRGRAGGRANRTSSTTYVIYNNTQGYFVGDMFYDRVYYGGSYGYWGPGNVFFVEGSPMFWGQVDNSVFIEQGGGFVDQGDSRDFGGGFVDQDNSPAQCEPLAPQDNSRDFGGGFVDQDNSPAQCESPAQYEPPAQYDPPAQYEPPSPQDNSSDFGGSGNGEW